MTTTIDRPKTTTPKATEEARSVRIEIMKITPELAQEWLHKNTHNRTLRSRVVDGLARAMERGEWVLNGEAIKWRADDILDDGQHRLHAVVKSGTTIESLVVFDLAEGAQETMDTGARRKFSDVLKLRGEVDTAALAATVRLFWRYEQGDVFTKDQQPTNKELLDCLDKHPGLREAVKTSSAMRHAIPGPASIYGTFAYVAMNINHEDGEEFINRFIDGVGLESTSPILHLRNYMMKLNSSRERPRTEIQLAVMLKAWNLYREGARIRLLSYKSGGKSPEAFPWAK